MDAARSSAASSVSKSRSPQTTQWAASTSARALAVLKPSSRRARGSTPSISEGSGPAGGVPSDGPECLGQPVQHGDDNRERQLLAGDRVRQALEDGREIGGLARDISPPTEPERVAFRSLVEVAQVDVDADHVVEHRRDVGAHVTPGSVGHHRYRESGCVSYSELTGFDVCDRVGLAQHAPVGLAVVAVDGIAGSSPQRRRCEIETKRSDWLEGEAARHVSETGLRRADRARPARADGGSRRHPRDDETNRLDLDTSAAHRQFSAKTGQHGLGSRRPGGTGLWYRDLEMVSTRPSGAASSATSCCATSSDQRLHSAASPSRMTEASDDSLGQSTQRSLDGGTPKIGSRQEVPSLLGR
jgi:hypothetical protein